MKKKTYQPFTENTEISYPLSELHFDINLTINNVITKDNSITQIFRLFSINLYKDKCKIIYFIGDDGNDSINFFSPPRDLMIHFLYNIIYDEIYF